MTDHDAAPVQQFLDVPVAQWEAVVQPDGVLDDELGETVAVGLEVGHGLSAYPDPIKATQPSLAVIPFSRGPPCTSVERSTFGFCQAVRMGSSGFRSVALPVFLTDP